MACSELLIPPRGATQTGKICGQKDERLALTQTVVYQRQENRTHLRTAEGEGKRPYRYPLQRGKF